MVSHRRLASAVPKINVMFPKDRAATASARSTQRNRDLKSSTSRGKLTQRSPKNNCENPIQKDKIKPRKSIIDPISECVHAQIEEIFTEILKKCE